MSSRVLRDDLWTSESIEKLHDKTFRLYACLINAADDYGLVETGFGHICRAAPLRRWTSEEVMKMLGEMYDEGVLLPYRSLDGLKEKTYCAIDKWQCFMRSVKPRCPTPSFGLGHIRMPYGFKNSRVREAATLLLKHLDIKGATLEYPQGVPGADLGHVGSRELGIGKKGRREKEEKKKTGTRAPRARRPVTPIPDDLALTEALIAHGLKLGLTRAEIERGFTRFCDNARAKAHTYADWPAAFRTWCSFDADRKRKQDPELDLTEGGRYIVS